MQKKAASVSRIIATIINECRLFLKDIAGLSLLLLMPIVLTVIMALIQDAPFREYQNIRFDVLWVDNDHGQLAKKLQEDFSQTKQFHLVTSVDDKVLDDAAVKALVQKGKYQIGIVIPNGLSAEVINSANQIANDIGSKIGAPGKLPQRESRPGNDIQVYFDPAAKQTFKLSIMNALEKFTTKSEAELTLSRLAKTMKSQDSDTNDSVNIDLQNRLRSVGIREASPVNANIYSATNSVQHNVPAWAIFGLFFIIIPIAGNMIGEREDGSLTRLKLIPGSYFDILFGKLFFYVMVGVVQFYLMLQAGVYLLPHLGLPALYMGHAPISLFITAIVISFTATSYGVLIGTVFQTANQALPFGSISIVILSAIGGIWVPVEILPYALQQLAKVSPLHWALDIINDLFLRNGSFYGILPKLSMLLGFSAVFFIIAGVVEKRRKR
ncbi:ABC transporter permease [Pinibacter soli]|uniref:ABC transporter permease n=1 Tax=Pinibacter soli TaxID=3044211 RepID=A0ABT6RI02_9BACT|nr:ABC transporter permease [Pinibacter soli]MDI3322180.1 ABC transporter permease [Pinibacter soli]